MKTEEGRCFLLLLFLHFIYPSYNKTIEHIILIASTIKAGLPMTKILKLESLEKRTKNLKLQKNWKKNTGLIYNLIKSTKYLENPGF